MTFWEARTRDTFLVEVVCTDDAAVVVVVRDDEEVVPSCVAALLDTLVEVTVAVADDLRED